MNKVKDIVGKIFGCLLVIGPFDRKKGHTYWLCRCKCGKEKSLRVDTLKNVGHCGCIKKKVKPLAGSCFNRLVVQDRFELRRIRNRIRTFWHCKCDCGNFKWVNRDCLVTKATSSCGCYSREIRERPLGEAAKTKLFCRYRADAQRRGLSFKLSKEEFAQIVFQSCTYCGRKEVSDYQPKRTNGGTTYTGIDRVDNSRGYTVDNCQPCCKDCNRAKWQLSDGELMNLIELIYLNRFVKTQDLSRRCTFTGRWQPPHASHEALIRTKLDKGEPCLILVRATPVNDKNPYTLQETLKMLRDTFEGEDVMVLPITDIEGIYYGRKVGYNVEEIDMPESVKRLSATEIRQKINSGDDSWKNYVMSGARKLLEEKLSNEKD